MSAVVARPESEGTLPVDRGDAMRQAELGSDDAVKVRSLVAVSGQIAAVCPDGRGRHPPDEIQAAKENCAKVVGTHAWPFDELQDDFDLIALGSEVRDGGRWQPYQAGSAATMLPPLKIVALWQQHGGVVREGVVLFLGTIPILDGRFRFRGHVTAPDGQRIGVSYAVDCH